MTEADFRYVLKRLGYTADQPIGLALHRVLIGGLPYGPSARSHSVPAHRLRAALDIAEALVPHFTVTDQEAAGLSANQLLAYAREREVPLPASTLTVTEAQLRAAGLTEEQIKGLLPCE